MFCTHSLELDAVFSVFMFPFNKPKLWSVIKSHILLECKKEFFFFFLLSVLRTDEYKRGVVSSIKYFWPGGDSVLEVQLLCDSPVLPPHLTGRVLQKQMLAEPQERYQMPLLPGLASAKPDSQR